MRRLGIKLSGREELAKLFGYDNVDDFLMAIGYGGITTRQIVLKLTAQQEPPKEVTEVVLPKRPVSAIKVLGVGDMLTQLARCCHPVPGDSIIGYVTRNRGVTVHRQDCHNVIGKDDKERLIPVEWAQTDSLYPVSVRVEAWDRVGLARDITEIVAEEKVNISTMNVANHDDYTTSILLALETKGLAQLSGLLARIEGVRGVMSVSRVGDEAAIKAGPLT